MIASERAHPTFDLGIAFAVLISAGPIAVLGHGFFGTGSVFTAIIMTLPLAVLLLLADWRHASLDLCDTIFSLFVTCIAISIFINGIPDRKELCLLAISLASYPAMRLSENVLTPRFVSTVSIIVALGSTVTAAALLTQWGDRHGKPMVFDQFDAAPAQFATSFAVLVIAICCTKLTWRNTLAISAILSIPTIVFAASMVRFTFVAMAITLMVVALCTQHRSRRNAIFLLTSILVLSVVVGVSSRWRTASVFVNHAATAADLSSVASDARMWGTKPGCPQVETDNSIAIRKQLYADGVRMIPMAGPFGLGLDNFARFACISIEPHNSVLQAFVEMGWLAGVLLVWIMVVLFSKSMLAVSRIDDETRFAFCCLIFSTLMCMAHGRTSRDVLLFACLGYAASLRARRAQIAQDWMMERVKSSIPA